ncbi:Hypothetical protein PHPALM_11938 [Phytophthora palmivora]|uniref:Uncharacterized protein n=1 Tax=Phytophthora palmivora TaxID=4796 RepID=A0A2P4Y189_9STRA|nr:Hypothetical protein PHPALM_11938 [Phytophthora palmivora]
MNNSKKNYLLLDWLDSQSVESVQALNAEFLPTIQVHTSMGVFDRHLIKDVPQFLKNIMVARRMLLVPHKNPLKEFIRLRKTSETKGGLPPCGICLGAAGEYLLDCTG